MPLDLPPFHARAPWWGGHLQTLRNRLVRSRVILPGRRKRLYMEVSDGSGDLLAAMLDMPVGPSNGPLIVLIHGLAGSENSDYIRWSAAYHLSQGRRVLRLNLRGAGPSRSTCGGQYHSGSAADIRDALTALEGSLTRDGLFLVGYSLGGNILINVLSAHADGLPIRGTATVSAPIDPAQAARRLMAPVNALYHKSLLKQMKRECTASGARISQSERHAIASARTLYDFDNTFTAVRNGYANADDYYARTAGWRVVPDIQIPTLLIQARNDPWVPPEPYESLGRNCPPNVKIILTGGGGHVGFHARDQEVSWHDRCIGAFLEALDCRPFKPV